ncbi:MAG: GntR family transcriptional regulator [Mangrovicoccus sp.]|nr:GntR family transcriptional regulator [Mangrovicoccus sp.]
MTDPQGKKSDQVAEALSKQVVIGAYQPGEKLRQDAIARDYGVSQATAREALLRLAAQGLAIIQPRRGMCVAPLDRNSVEELKLMRLALEPMALLHSVPHLSSVQIAEAEAQRNACDSAETALDWEEANRRFHMAIIAGCAMPRLMEEIDNLQLLYARHFLAKHASRWRQRHDPDHHAIMLAIQEGDGPRASSVLHRHLMRLS